MKTASRKNIFLAVAAGAVIAALPVLFVLADQGIVPDACRLGNAGPCTICHLGVLVINFTKFLMYTIAFPSAVFLIIIGGLTLLVSGPSETTRTLGKKILTNTLVGMIIIMLAWLAVDTIIKFLVGGGRQNFIGLGPWYTIDAANCLISGESLMPSLSVPPPVAALPPPQVTAQPTLINNVILSRLATAGIEVRSTGRSSSGGNCYDITNRSCTNLDSLPPRTFDYLKNIKAVCGSPVIITGGAEAGHSTAHGADKATVDLSYNQTTASCMRNRVQVFNIRRICTRPQEAAYRYNCSTNEDAPHLHVEFN